MGWFNAGDPKTNAGATETYQAGFMNGMTYYYHTGPS